MIKRIIAAIGLNLLMILFFSACDNNINGDTNTKSDANPLTNTPTPISINHAANSHTTTESDTSTTTIPSSNETTEVTPTVNISDSDTNKTCLVDKFHNIFFGTIDTEEICMDFYLDGNNITAFYISKASENEVKLVGKLNGFNITLKDLSQNTLTGTISSYDELGKFQGTFSQSNGKELPMDLYKSYACGGSLDNFYEIMGSNNNEVENFVSELKNNLISTNKKAVAQVVNIQ